MSVDTVVLGNKLRLDNKSMVTHLTKLNENNIEDRTGHIHSQCRDGGQQSKLREIKQCIEIGTRKDIAYLH